MLACMRRARPVSTSLMLGALLVLGCTGGPLTGSGAPPDGAVDKPDLALSDGAVQRVDTTAQLEAQRPWLRVHMVDVGQGDGLVITLPDGAVLAVDGGPSISGDFEQFLQRKKIERVDYVLLSHAHADHYLGLGAALRRLPDDCEARVFDPGFDRSSDPNATGYSYFRNTAGCRYRALAVNQTVAFDKQAAVEVVGTTAVPFPKQDGAGINNTSLIVRISYGRFRLLLTGDAQTDGEKAAVAAFPRGLAATVLKVGHHGSCNSTGDTFLGAVQPELALLSAGAGNDFGHPHCQTLTKLKARGANWLRTDVNGDIEVTTDGLRYTATPTRGIPTDEACPRSCAEPSNF
jgi:competence protein ComEC